MMKKSYMLVIFLVSSISLQMPVHGQMDEFEVSEEEIASEGSGKSSRKTMPSDDEDINSEESGSGKMMKNETEESTDFMLTTTTVIENELEEKSEVSLTTNPPQIQVEQEETEMSEEGNLSPVDTDSDVSEENEEDQPTETPTEENKFPMEEEKDEVDVEVELEEDKDNVDISDGSAGGFLGSTQFMAALIVGGCVGLLFAICVIMLLAYRMRKKDEGSYALDDPKKRASSSEYQYTAGQSQEYYA